MTTAAVTEAARSSEVSNTPAHHAVGYGMGLVYSLMLILRS
jgi:hypothetical protein